MDLIKLLLVEDDTDYRTIIKECLEMTGEYTVFEAKNGLEGYEIYKSYPFDIIVTDVDMPKVSGLEMVDLIRKDDIFIPILVASGLTNPQNIDEGFKHDIDNYIKKPFTPDELDGFIKAILKRIMKNNQMMKKENNKCPLGSYLFDIENRRLIHKQKNIHLSKREAQILFMLYSNRGKVVLRSAILKQFWGAENDPFHSRSLDVFITKLRNYLKDDKSVIISTLRGEGLRLDC